ncbi:MAG: serine/threonine-protein kinase [Bacteroidota bacterium]
MALFDAVSTLPAAKRTAYLDKACADHPEWRRVLNAMLAEFDASTSAGGLWPRLRPALNVGDQVGRYRIVRELGEGGMGVVFLADDPRLDRVVAVKLIRLGRLATPGQIRRFSHEINILARLRHPAIATIYDAGATADGVPYFAMEYVEGQPLDVYANAQGLDVKERLRLLIAAAEAVQYAHQNLIIHRDLKPSNLLVEVGDKRPPRVKLLDFGIAKLLDDSSGQPGLTRTGERLFTPAYAAPEQLAGRPVSTATDVYALGVVLYELLTGTRPFSNDLHSDARQTLPHRPSMVLAQQAPPSVGPPSFEAILTRLCFAPSSRTPTAATAPPESWPMTCDATSKAFPCWPNPTRSATVLGSSCVAMRCRWRPRWPRSWPWSGSGRSTSSASRRPATAPTQPSRPLNGDPT